MITINLKQYTPHPMEYKLLRLIDNLDYVSLLNFKQKITFTHKWYRIVKI